MKIYILISLFSIIFNSYIKATTYYISTNGSDISSGTSEFQAWANFNYAISKIKTGDKLIILDGTYYQSINISKSGTANSPITIRAKNDGKVTIDGQDVRRPITISGNYIIVEGIIFQHSNNNIVSITGNHNTFKRCSAYYSQRKHCWAIDEARFNLIEDCVGAATERHIFKSYSSNGLETHNTFRRCFGIGTIPNQPSTKCESEFNCYAGSYDIFENCIGWGGTGYASISVHSQDTHYRMCCNNKILGSLFMRSHGDYGYGIIIGRGNDGNQENPKDNYFENCIIYDNIYGVRLEDRCDNTIFNHCTIINNSHYGIKSQSVSNIIKNVILINNKNGYSDVRGSFSYINLYGNESHNLILNSWPHSNSSNPLINKAGLTIPEYSPCKGTGENSTDIGANINYRYENGVLTNKSLWPWPMQERIKNELDIDVMTELESIFGPIQKENLFKASISVSTLSGLNPLTVKFIGNSVGGIPPNIYSWNFGDGTTSNKQNPNHTYNEVGNYTVVFTVTDRDSNQATNSIIINVLDPSDFLSITDIKLSLPNENQEITQIQRETWYDLYLYFNTPNGWSDIAFTNVWINSPSYLEGTIENRGGMFHASSSYIITFKITEGYEEIWARQIESSYTATNITGSLGLYVDDRNNEFEINSNEGWVKGRMKLLSEAENGDWFINAYVRSRNGSESNLYKKNIECRVSNIESNIDNTQQLTLQQNYPNPFTHSMKICYSLPFAADVRLNIFNILGQHIITLVKEKQYSGTKIVRWDGRDKNGIEVSNGIYFYRLKAGDFYATKKIVLIR